MNEEVKKELKGKSILVYDIETRTFGKPDITRDEVRIFGCYSYKTDKTYLLTKREQIQKAIDSHDFLVGFNNVGTKDRPGYDNPILERQGYNLKYKKCIDLRNIIVQRAAVMKIKKGMLGNLLTHYSLDFITKLLGIGDGEGKDEIDYKIFMKPVWTNEELQLVSKYTKRDIQITKELYEWVEDYFWSFRDFLHKHDIDKKEYLTISIAKFAYKAICKAMKWEETYNTHSNFIKDDIISGGYVAYPAGEKFEGDIFLLDFSSLYPFIMMMCNIHDRKDLNDFNDDRPFWDGNGIWKTNGLYHSDKMGQVGTLLKNWYRDRTEYKKAGDRREYTIKIIINTIYGILDNEYYEKVFDKTASGDVTRIGRQWILYARKVFRENGYTNCFTDTDSIGVHDKFNDKEKVMKLCKQIEDYILSTVPFPQESFKFKIDDEIKYMYFFKGGDKNKVYPKNEFFSDMDDDINKLKGLMKKNYIYVTKDNRVIIKNLGLKKKDRTELSKKIFWEHLVPKIKEGEIKFSKTFLKNLINKLLHEDINLALMRRDVGTVEQYKNTTSIQAQMAKRYGTGLHFVIPNKRSVGVGKGKSFCTMEEFKEHNLSIDDIDLRTVWKELEYFTKSPMTKSIFDFIPKDKEKEILNR